MLEVFDVITGTRSSLLETPPGFGSQLKQFKCQPPPPVEGTPEFHPELRAVTSTWRTTSLLIREVAATGKPRPIPCACFDARVFHRVGKIQRQKIKKKHLLLGSSVCSSPGTLNTMNPPRIRVWSWMGFVLQTVTERLQIYVENKALLNFPGLVWKYYAREICVYACDVGERSIEEYGCTVKYLLWSKVHRRGMAPGCPGRRRGRGGRNIKGHERKQETVTLRGERKTWGRDADCWEDENTESRE